MYDKIYLQIKVLAGTNRVQQVTYEAVALPMIRTRWKMALAPSGHILGCSIAATSVVCMSLVNLLLYYRYQLWWTTSCWYCFNWWCYTFKMLSKYGANTLLPKSIIIRLLCTLQMAYPRLELICCLYACIEEVWWLKRSQAQKHHTI